MLNNLFTFALKPTEAIDNIIKRRSLGLALSGYFTGAISLAIWTAINGGGYSSAKFCAAILGYLVLEGSLGFFLASSAHLLLELSTGKGSAAGLFTLIGLSDFVKTLLVAFALISGVFTAAAGFGVVVFLAVLLLQLYFVLYMMQKVYGLGKARTFFTMLLSFAPAAVSILTAFTALITAIIFLLLF